MKIQVAITSAAPGGVTVAKHGYTYDTLENIATWKCEAPLANPTGLTRRFTSKVFYDNSDQVSSVIHTNLAGTCAMVSILKKSTTLKLNYPSNKISRVTRGIRQNASATVARLFCQLPFESSE